MKIKLYPEGKSFPSTSLKQQTRRESVSRKMYA